MVFVPPEVAASILNAFGVVSGYTAWPIVSSVPARDLRPSSLSHSFQSASVCMRPCSMTTPE